MIALLCGMAAAFGAIVGSFLNVVIWRLPRGEPMGMVRSKCPRCGHQIAWFDNVPVLSWLVLRGRCRACRAPISFRYPLVELVTAALFYLCAQRTLALGWTPPALAFAVTAAFAAVVVAAAFIDWDEKILPDTLTLRAGPVVALVASLGVPDLHGAWVFGADLSGIGKPALASLLAGLAGAAVGAGVIGAIRRLGSALLKKEAMGLGDVKFMAMAGLMLGPGGVLLALAVALVAGSVLGAAIWAVTRDKEVPFGPFLGLGSLTALLYRPELAYLVLEAYPAWVRGDG